jgi:hypothetical protein
MPPRGFLSKVHNAAGCRLLTGKGELVDVEACRQDRMLQSMLEFKWCGTL